MAIQISNDLGLSPIAKHSEEANPGPTLGQASSSRVEHPNAIGPGIAGSFPMEFAFELPKGYLDEAGNLHRRGVMRLSKAIDEIVPMRDPRVRSNPAYATVLILSRVITHLGALDEVTPLVIEGLFACDLNYLQNFYRHINELDSQAIPHAAPTPPVMP